MSSIRKLASQTAVYGLSSIIGRIVVWGLTPIYTARLEPGEYGVFSDLYSFVTYFLVILTFGMETSFFRFSSDDKMNQKPYSQSFLFVGILAMAFLAICGIGHQAFANFLGYDDRPQLILMVVFIIFLDVIVSIPMAKIRYDERPIVFAMISLASIFVNIVFNIWFILILKKTNAEYVFISNLIASGFKFVLLAFFSTPLADRLKSLGAIGQKLSSINVLPESLNIDKKMMKAMVGFGFYIMLAGLFGMLNQNSDVNFIQRIWGSDVSLFGEKLYNGSEMAGIYSANKKLAVFILLVTQAFRYAAEPFYFRHAKESDSRVVYARVFHYFMLASLSVFLLVSSFSFEFVSTKIMGFQLINEQYWDGLGVVPLLLLSFVFWGAYINISIWFKLTKQVRFGILFSFVGVMILFLLFFILIPLTGFYGAAIGMLASYIVMTIMAWLIGHKYYPIPYKMGRIFFYFCLFMFVFFINASYGQTAMFSSAFFYKLLYCVIAFGLIYGFEKFLPVKWSGGTKKDEVVVNDQNIEKPGGNDEEE